MIKTVKVFSRNMAEHFVSNLSIVDNKRHFALISIYGEEGKLTCPNIDKLELYGCIGYLPLEFWDLVPDNFSQALRAQFPKSTIFSEQQAHAVVNFLKMIHSDIRDCILIPHCAAGISRSGAVGQFATDLFNLDQGIFEKNNPHIMPNSWVMRLLRKASGFENNGSSFKVNDRRKVTGELFYE